MQQNNSHHDSESTVKSINKDGLFDRAEIAGFDRCMGSRFISAFEQEDMSVDEIARYADTSKGIMYRILDPEFY